MTKKWRSAVDAGLVVDVPFIDFRKVFDSVSHPILLKKLRNSNGNQYTVVNDVPSDVASGQNRRKSSL